MAAAFGSSKDCRRDLVRAAALPVAEIERLGSADGPQPPPERTPRHDGETDPDAAEAGPREPGADCGGAYGGRGAVAAALTPKKINAALLALDRRRQRGRGYGGRRRPLAAFVRQNSSASGEAVFIRG